MKCAFLFSLQLLSETFPILRRNERDIKYIHRSSCKVPIMLVRFLTLNAELNPVCHLLALLGAHHILRVFRIRVTLKLFSKYKKKNEIEVI